MKFREHSKHLLLKVRESKVGSEFDFGMVWYGMVWYGTIPFRNQILNSLCFLELLKVHKQTGLGISLGHPKVLKKLKSNFFDTGSDRHVIWTASKLPYNMSIRTGVQKVTFQLF